MKLRLSALVAASMIFVPGSAQPADVANLSLDASVTVPSGLRFSLESLRSRDRALLLDVVESLRKRHAGLLDGAQVILTKVRDGSLLYYRLDFVGLRNEDAARRICGALDMARCLVLDSSGSARLLSLMQSGTGMTATFAPPSREPFVFNGSMKSEDIVRMVEESYKDSLPPDAVAEGLGLGYGRQPVPVARPVPPVKRSEIPTPELFVGKPIVPGDAVVGDKTSAPPADAGTAADALTASEDKTAREDGLETDKSVANGILDLLEEDAAKPAEPAGDAWVAPGDTPSVDPSSSPSEESAGSPEAVPAQAEPALAPSPEVVAPAPAPVPAPAPGVSPTPAPMEPVDAQPVPAEAVPAGQAPTAGVEQDAAAPADELEVLDYFEVRPGDVVPAPQDAPAAQPDDAAQPAEDAAAPVVPVPGGGPAVAADPVSPAPDLPPGEEISVDQTMPPPVAIIPPTDAGVASPGDVPAVDIQAEPVPADEAPVLENSLPATSGDEMPAGEGNTDDEPAETAPNTPTGEADPDEQSMLDFHERLAQRKAELFPFATGVLRGPVRSSVDVAEGAGEPMGDAVVEAPRAAGEPAALQAGPAGSVAISLPGIGAVEISGQGGFSRATVEEHPATTELPIEAAVDLGAPAMADVGSDPAPVAVAEPASAQPKSLLETAIDAIRLPKAAATRADAQLTAEPAPSAASAAMPEAAPGIQAEDVLDVLPSPGFSGSFASGNLLDGILAPQAGGDDAAVASVDPTLPLEITPVEVSFADWPADEAMATGGLRLPSVGGAAMLDLGVPDWRLSDWATGTVVRDAMAAPDRLAELGITEAEERTSGDAAAIDTMTVDAEAGKAWVSSLDTTLTEIAPNTPGMTQSIESDAASTIDATVSVGPVMVSKEVLPTPAAPSLDVSPAVDHGMASVIGLSLGGEDPSTEDDAAVRSPSVAMPMDFSKASPAGGGIKVKMNEATIDVARLDAVVLDDTFSIPVMVMAGFGDAVLQKLPLPRPTPPSEDEVKLAMASYDVERVPVLEQIGTARFSRTGVDIAQAAEPGVAPTMISSGIPAGMEGSAPSIIGNVGGSAIDTIFDEAAPSPAADPVSTPVAAPAAPEPTAAEVAQAASSILPSAAVQPLASGGLTMGGEAAPQSGAALDQALDKMPSAVAAKEVTPNQARSLIDQLTQATSEAGDDAYVADGVQAPSILPQAPQAQAPVVQAPVVQATVTAAPAAPVAVESTGPGLMARAEPVGTTSKDFVSNPEMRIELSYVSRREDVPSRVEELRSFFPGVLLRKGRFFGAALASAPGIFIVGIEAKDAAARQDLVWYLERMEIPFAFRR